jgi:hypothetical protein
MAKHTPPHVSAPDHAHGKKEYGVPMAPKEHHKTNIESEAKTAGPNGKEAGGTHKGTHGEGYPVKDGFPHYCKDTNE